MKSDIQNRTDIESLVNTFYDKVKADDTIGYIFHKIIGEDWSHHLPIMYSFWEMVLMNKQGYKGNPVKKHIEVDQQVPLEDAHYKRWLQLWEATVDDMYKGDTADEAKKRAGLMMHLIKMKVEMARTGKTLF